MILVSSASGHGHAEEVLKELGEQAAPCRLLDLADVTAIWLRRPQPYRISPEIIPDTLITKEPEEARSFWEAHAGNVVCKPFRQTHRGRQLRLVRGQPSRPVPLRRTLIQTTNHRSTRVPPPVRRLSMGHLIWSGSATMGRWHE